MVAWGGRLTRLAPALLGVGLLAVAILSGVTADRQAALDDLDHALTSEAASNAVVLREYFVRAQSIDLLLAHDSVFRQFEPGGVARSKPQTVVASAEAGEAMAYLEDLDAGWISEACLIDRTGTELARVVRGRVAPSADLSTQEARNSFFAPTMRLQRGRVYQAAPYLSDDTRRWVISNSTPMVTTSGQPWGFVHFEVLLEGFRPHLTDGSRSRGFSASIMDTDTGRILLETGRVLRPGSLGRLAPVGLRVLASRFPESTSADVAGHRIAVNRVLVGPDNANSWAVVISAPKHSGVRGRSIGNAPVAMALAAILLLGFAGLNFRSHQRELRKVGLTDELTGLPNRRLLNDRVEQALLLAKRRATTCAVLIIDLDRFNEVNDALGHQHGDQLLRGVARRLEEALRESDTIARVGGDEFAVLLPGIRDEAAALLLAERCLASLHEAFTIEDFTVNVEASIGLALAPQHGSDRGALLRSADIAMHEAKTRSGGIAIYDPALDINTPTRLALLGDLRRALRDGELFLHYQPKVELDTDEVRAVEALVRWQHPTRGLIPPDDFIPVAEGTGLIMSLTLGTVDMAIAQARRWQAGGQVIQVAVNLSPRCLLDMGLPELIHNLLERHGLPAHLLRLEITENTLMADPARALTVLAELHQSGIALSIDDFGTGYSSMSYLKRLPIDELKIDKGFVIDMLANSGDHVLVRSLIDLGHNLGLSVVAEGVEDEATLTALRELRCDVAQGYHLARPMTGTEFTDWLVARSVSIPLRPEDQA
jgi:diguanylate cyclase (GGDEF)-like protein